MKFKVNQEACIGCGACCAYAEEVFEINEDGLSEVVKEEISDEEEQNVKDAMDACPTSAIEEVAAEELKEAA